MVTGSKRGSTASVAVGAEGIGQGRERGSLGNEFNVMHDAP
jgi:hypothetical protein